MSYNQLMACIQKGTDAEDDPDSLFNFRDIVAHHGEPVYISSYSLDSLPS